MQKKYLYLLLLPWLLSSCEDDMFLRSEKKMSSELQGTWRREWQGQIPVVTCNLDTFIYTEYWIFKDNNFFSTYTYTGGNCDRGTIDLNKVDAADTVLVCNFKVDARLFDAYLKFKLISGANDSANQFIDKWEFVTLEDDILYLATDDPKGGIAQREFLKVQ